MATVYTFCKQLHAPTSIELSAYCNLVDPEEKCLVTAGVNQIHIYRLRRDAGSSTDPGFNSANISGIGSKSDKTTVLSSKKERLECVSSFQLFGNVVSMKAVRLANSNLDALLLSFRDAKLSLVEYDCSTHDLKTLSLHYFEDDEFKDGRSEHSNLTPQVQVDPDSRCAAMLTYGRRLVILPFQLDSSSASQSDASSIPGLTSRSINPSLSTGHTPQVLTSYVIDLHKMDERIINVLDFQFLHGYHEPTIAILHEPLPTWSGRLAVRKDTCSLLAISLNMEQKVHPVIWSIDNLPYDCQQIVPTPKPAGGMLVMAVNSLIYLNQSCPPFGVSLNSITNVATDFNLKAQDDVTLTLDSALSCFISSDKLILALRAGELYVVTMLMDGVRSVRGFHFNKAASSVPATSICECGEGYIFLGSRLSNSLLLRYSRNSAEETSRASSPTSVGGPDLVEPATKKQKTVNETKAAATSSDDLDDLEVYGSELQRADKKQIAQYSFEMCDSLVHIGPCGQVVMGEPAFLSEEFSSHAEDHDLELVTTSGYGKTGGLTVLQRTIRPHVVTTFYLGTDCVDLWTVFSGPDRGKGSSDSAGHSLLILSKEDDSMILKTGQEILELEESGFYTQGPTIHAGNIGNNRYIVQVFAHGVRLLDGIKQKQHIKVDLDSPVISCSVADPYIVLMTQDGQIALLTFTHTGAAPCLTLSTPTLHGSSQLSSDVVTLCAYQDVSGMFSMASSKQSQPTATASTSINNSMNADEEDELLYGSSDTTHLTGRSVSGFMAQTSDNSTHSNNHQLPDSKSPTYWVALCRANGDLEMYKLPEFKLCYHVKNFRVGEKLLMDYAEQLNLTAASSSTASVISMPAVGVMDNLEVKEILLVGLGANRSRPYLMARVNEELLIYEAFVYHPPPTVNSSVSSSTNISSEVVTHLRLRFRKCSHGLLIRAKKQREGAGESEDQRSRVRWLRPFTDIGGYAGVFLCGPCPHWLLMTSHGMLRCHPMNIDGTVTCFTPFHNVNCPKGFMYFNKQGEMRIAVLPSNVSYDSAWPFRKVPLRSTVYNVAYHPDSKTYGVVTSVSELTNRLIKVVGDGDKEFETVEKDERFVLPPIERFSIQLLSGESWESIPNTRYECEEYEKVTCMQTVNLKCEGTRSGRKSYIVAGTNYAYSEDITCKGRIIILDVIEVVPEPGQPLTKNKLKIEYDKEQKGAISAIDGVEGFLVTAIGQKIYIWQLEDDGGLKGVAFIDAQIYIHQVCSIKNLILTGDILKSIFLLRYQEDMKILSHVSRDIRLSQVYSIAFLVDSSKLNFLASDRHKNLLVYAYNPQLKESNGGQRLTLVGDINIGSHVLSFFRVRTKQHDPSIDRMAYTNLKDRHITYFATLDGSIGYLSPISEWTFRRLHMLQNALNNQIPHTAGLNPRGYRMGRHIDQPLLSRNKSIVDGDLVWKYLSLSAIEKAEISHRIGASQDQILSDLVDIDRTTAHF